MGTGTNQYNNIEITDLLNQDESSSALDWNWKGSFVEPDMGIASAGSFLSSESTLVCVGPPIASSSFVVYRLGVSPGFSLSQQIPQQRLAEIGSKRVHIINGTPVGGGSIQRFLYNGKTLLKASYGNIFNEDGELTSKSGVSDEEKQMWNKMTGDTSYIAETHNKNNLWISMWDDKVKFPIGFAIYFQDQIGNKVGGFYIEGVKYSHTVFRNNLPSYCWPKVLISLSTESCL